MWKKNEDKSIAGRTAWDFYCINCNTYLGSTVAGENHRYERGGICPVCKKDIDRKEESNE